MDLSKLSDEELLKLAAGSQPNAPDDLSKLSDEELLKLAGQSAPVASKPLVDSGVFSAKGSKPSPLQETVGNVLRSGLSGQLMGLDTLVLPESEERKAWQEAHPVLDVGAQVVGGLIPSPVNVASKIAGGVRLGAQGLAKAAPILEKALSPAVVAGLEGAVLGGTVAGVSEAKKPEGEMSPADILKSAGFGALGGVLTTKALESLPKLKAALEKFSQQRAVKSIEPMKREYEAIAKMRGGKVEDLGKTLLDEGIIGNIPVSKEKLLERVAAKGEKAGQKLGSVVEEIGSLPGAENAVSRSKIASQMREKLLQPLKGVIGGEEQLSKLDDLISRFEAQGAEGLSLKEAEELKRTYQNLVKYDRKVNAAQPVIEKFQEGLASNLRKEAESAAEAVAKQAGKPELASEFLKQKKLYGDLATAEGVLEKAQLNEQARRFISPSDYGVGAAGAVAQAAAGGGLGGMAAGAALGGVNKAVRQYGSQVAAKQSQNLARILDKSENMRRLYAEKPELVMSAYNQMIGRFRDNNAIQRQESKPITSEYVPEDSAAKMFLDNP